MNKEERRAAEQAVRDLVEVNEQIKKAYASCKALEFFHRWKLEYECILRVCGLLILRIMQDIVDVIDEADKRDTLGGEK